MYFNNFPTMDYDMDDTKTNIKVTDVFRRLALRKNIGNFTTNYYERVLNSYERPEIVSHMEYGVVDRHWIMMMINNVEDPYYDWILDNEQIEKFIVNKYPGKTIVFPTTHLSDGSYGAVESDPIERFFVVGETITEYLSTGSSSGMNGLGVVTEFNPTELDLTYSVTSGTFETEEGIEHFVKGSDSGAVGKISSISDSIFAPHHYINSDSDIVDRDVVPAPTVVNNFDYEMEENEKKRTINVLMEGFASILDSELKVELNR